MIMIMTAFAVRRENYSRKPGFTETRFRPLARRRASTACPPLVLMRTRKPCVLERRRRFGWNVRFGMDDGAPDQKFPDKTNSEYK